MITHSNTNRCVLISQNEQSNNSCSRLKCSPYTMLQFILTSPMLQSQLRRHMNSDANSAVVVTSRHSLLLL